MFSTVLGLFTGAQKWLYIALVVCAVGFVGASALSISLFADKTALHVSLSSKEGEIATLKKEHKEAIDKLQNEKDKVSKDLTQTKADLQMQNAINEQYAIDSAKKEKEYQEALAKKPSFRTQYVQAPRTSDEAQDLLSLIQIWRTQK